jgi:hypothetical protein
LSERQEPSSFWTDAGPLYSLSAAILLIVPTSRTAYAVLMFLCLLIVNPIAVLSIRLARGRVSGPYFFMAQVVAVSAFASCFSAAAGILWPLTVFDMRLYLGAVPVFFLSSRIYERSAAASSFGAFISAAEEAFIVGALGLAVSLIREPFGFGSLSLPAADGLMLLFASDAASAVAARSLSAAAGGFWVLGYGLALYKKIRVRLYGARSPREAQ